MWELPTGVTTIGGTLSCVVFGVVSGFGMVFGASPAGAGTGAPGRAQPPAAPQPVEQAGAHSSWHFFLPNFAFSLSRKLTFSHGSQTGAQAGAQTGAQTGAGAQWDTAHGSQPQSFLANFALSLSSRLTLPQQGSQTGPQEAPHEPQPAEIGATATGAAGAASAPAIQTEVSRIIDAFTLCNLQEEWYVGSVADAEVQTPFGRPTSLRNLPSPSPPGTPRKRPGPKSHKSFRPGSDPDLTELIEKNRGLPKK